MPFGAHWGPRQLPDGIGHRKPLMHEKARGGAGSRGSCGRCRKLAATIRYSESEYYAAELMSLELSGYVTNSGRVIGRATRLATQDGFATSLEGTFYLGEPALASSTNRSEVFGAEAASRCRPERRTETPAQHRCTEYACRAVAPPAADSRLGGTQ